jgi:hypothetical protein
MVPLLKSCKIYTPNLRAFLFGIKYIGKINFSKNFVVFVGMCDSEVDWLRQSVIDYCCLFPF